MPALFTENFRFSNTVKHEYEPSIAFCREQVVYNGTAGELKIGVALGKVTATGQYKISVQTATDGSQNPVAVVIQEATAALNTDIKVLALVRGPAIVSKAGLILDASFNDDAKKAAAYASLAAVSILANNAV